MLVLYAVCYWQSLYSSCVIAVVLKPVWVSWLTTLSPLKNVAAGTRTLHLNWDKEMASFLAT